MAPRWAPSAPSVHVVSPAGFQEDCIKGQKNLWTCNEKLNCFELTFPMRSDLACVFVFCLFFVSIMMLRVYLKLGKF